MMKRNKILKLKKYFKFGEIKFKRYYIYYKHFYTTILYIYFYIE